MTKKLIDVEEEKRLLEKLINYYEKLYPGVKFSVEKKVFTPEEIGEILYTFAGAESEATFEEETKLIMEELKRGYNTPVILLKKGNEYIILDGHRRLKVAWENSLNWPAFIIVPDKELSFGIEKMIIGKIKTLWFKKL